jgi:serine/threonine protein kinase
MLVTDKQFFLSYQLFSSWQLWIDWVNNIKGGITVGTEKWGVELIQVEEYSDKNYVVLVTQQLATTADFFFAGYSSGLTGPLIKSSDAQKKFAVTAGSNINTVWNGSPKYAIGMLYEDQFKDPMTMFYQRGARTAAYFCTTAASASTCPTSIQRDIIDKFATYGITVKLSFPLDPTAANYPQLIASAMQNVSKADVDLIVVKDYAPICTDIVTWAVTLDWTPKGVFFSACTEVPSVKKTLDTALWYISSYTMWSASAVYTSGISKYSNSYFTNTFQSQYQVAPTYQAAAAFAGCEVLTAAIERQANIDPSRCLHGPTIANLTLHGRFSTIMSDVDITFSPLHQAQAKWFVLQYSKNATLVVVPTADELVYPMPTWAERKPVVESSVKVKTKLSSTTLTILYSVGAVLAVLFAALIVYIVYQARKHAKVQMDFFEANKKRNERFAVLPVHSALFHWPVELPLDHKLETLIKQNQASLKELDFDENSAFHLAYGRSLHTTILFVLLEVMLPCKWNSKLGIIEYLPPEEHRFAWITAVSDNANAELVEQILHRHRILVDTLSKTEDLHGKTALACASSKCQEVILRALYFLNRYEVTTNIHHPHHKSLTCAVHLAIDHNTKQKVALKLMKNFDQFAREVAVREKGSFSDDSVISILEAYNGDENPAYVEEAERKGFGEYSYCIVMPAADRSLKDIIDKEFDSKGHNLHVIRSFMANIIEALMDMHGNGFIHGDVKPLNICRVGHKLKLIDLDASASTTNEFAGSKFSSAFIPPELVMVSEDGLKATVKTFQTDPTTELPITTGLAYELVTAQPAYDVWAVGMTLYRLCSDNNMPFFLANRDDNIDNRSLIDLYDFTDEFKKEKLSKIPDSKARNLVAQMLTKDPEKRLALDKALSHPFMTGAQVTRMLNEDAEFDVFISYRVESDLEHADMLYNRLKDSGLKVWIDRKVKYNHYMSSFYC